MTRHVYPEAAEPAHREAGHTLAELSVVLVLGVLLTALCYRSLAYVQSTTARHERRRVLAETSNILFHRLADDLAGAAEVRASPGPDTSWTLLRAAHRPIRYTVREGRLLRDGVPTHDAEARVGLGLAVAEAGPQGRAVRFEVSVRRRGAERTVSGVVDLRVPAAWPPAGEGRPPR